MKAISLQISEAEAGDRVDKFLAVRIPEYSRSYFVGLTKEGKILVNGKIAKPSYRLLSGDTIEAELTELQMPSDPEAESIPIDILYEDANVIVLNKQAGLVVHPGTENASGTLVNALIHYFPNITEAVYDSESIVSKSRPGLVHRLDKDTSGVIIVAKTKQGMEFLSEQIHDRKATKTYLALCYGRLKHDSGKLHNYLGRDPKHRMRIAEIGKGKGKEAISDYQVEKIYKDKSGNYYSLVRVNLETGRTHQIRVQMSIIGNPVIGDTLYGTSQSKKASLALQVKRQLLHASTLSICLPGDTAARTFEAPLPPDFDNILKKIASIE